MNTASLDNSCLQRKETHAIEHLQLLPELGLAGTDVRGRPPIIQRPQHFHLVQCDEP
jgi:hypothetical protein